MTMRDKIAEALVNVLEHYRSSQFIETHAADAILAALPDMIAPLVWPTFSKGQIYQQAAPVIYGNTYNVRGTNNTGWNAYYGKRMISPSLSCQLQAQTAANAHHVAQIMAAFTGENK